MDFSLNSKIKVELNKRFVYSVPIKFFFMALSFYFISYMLSFGSRLMGLPFKFEYSLHTLLALLLSCAATDFIKYSLVCNQRSFNSVLGIIMDCSQNFELLIVFPIWAAINVVTISKLVSIFIISTNQLRDLSNVEVVLISIINTTFFLTDKSNFSLSPIHVCYHIQLI